jgi:Pentapeptide repeats (8 copies)
VGKVSWSEQAESDLESLVANPAVRAQIKHIAEEILHDIPPRTCPDDGSVHGIMWHRCITWEQKRQLEEAELEEAELEEAELEEAELEEAELEEAELEEAELEEAELEEEQLKDTTDGPWNYFLMYTKYNSAKFKVLGVRSTHQMASMWAQMMDSEPPDITDLLLR